jgi:hypothetical protein
MIARRPLVFLLCLLTGGLTALGCTMKRDAPTAPPVPAGSSALPSRGDDSAAEPSFLRADAASPSIANPVVAFWAKQGEDRRVRMYYHAAAGSPDSTTFLEFRVGKASLNAYPDGRRFATGDSVRITITLVDAERLAVECQPSGLRFSTQEPARLKMSFDHADADVNGDGTVNEADVAVERMLRIWRRESDDGPWTSQRSAVEVGIHEVRSDVYGFSGYVIAY